MQKAPVMKGSGLQPLTDDKSSNSEEVVHIFGKNLEERVVNNDDNNPDNNQSNSQSEEDDIESIRKRKFDAITGEEDEETIFQGDFKLFVWDKTSSNWIEKGRGQLKLNDSIDQDEKRSRLIMRVNGTLRILLNVSIKRSYFRVITNSKTHIRFTDGQTVWAASGSNVIQLKDLIEERRKLEEENELRKKVKSDSNQETLSSSTASATSEEATTTTTKSSSPSTSPSTKVDNELAKEDSTSGEEKSEEETKNEEEKKSGEEEEEGEDEKEEEGEDKDPSVQKNES